MLAALTKELNKIGMTGGVGLMRSEYGTRSLR